MLFLIFQKNSSEPWPRKLNNSYNKQHSETQDIIKFNIFKFSIFFVLDAPPSPISLHDRFSSPMAGSAKRRLFGDDPQPQYPVKQISVTPMKIIPNTSTEHNNQNMTTATVLSMADTNFQQLNIPLPGVCVHKSVNSPTWQL